MIERTRSRYLWSEDNVNGTRMGRYLTGVESRLIVQAFDEFGWPKILLDVGGGDGRLVKPLVKRGAWPVILDQDPVPLEDLRESEWHYPLIIADGNVLPIKSSCLDAALAFEVAEFTNATRNANFFKEVYRVLRKTGIFLLECDNRNSLIGVIKEHGENKGKPQEQRVYYSEKLSDTREKLMEAGFQIMMVNGFRWIPFSRTSDNKLIPFFAGLEKFLKLGNLPHFSPWVFWAAVK